MGLLTVKPFLLLMLLSPGNAFWENVPAVKKNSKTEIAHLATPKIKLVIEVAIFCDKDFGKLFAFDQQKIEQYWAAVMYDVHLRFKTLQSFDISFRVTLLLVFSTPRGQSFLEIERAKDGFYSTVDVAYKFQIWTYFQANALPKLDIAVLALGTHKADSEGYYDFSEEDTICKESNDKVKRWPSTIVVTMKAHPAEDLARNIAHVLGAPTDDNPDYWHICNPYPNNAFHCCILGESRPHTDIRPHFFSRCTDHILALKLSKNITNNTFCLNNANTQEHALIDTEHLYKNPSVVHSYTTQEQCELLSNDKSAKIDFNTCLMSSCKSSKRPIAFGFVPLDGSKCGQNDMGRCLRTTCIEPKVQLVNVALGKCLVPEDGQFSINGKPILRDCDKISMDLLVGVKIGPVGIYVPTVMYSTEHGPRFKHLKLVLDPRSNHSMKFEPGVDMASSWRIKRLSDSRREEFLLMHGLVTLYCATAVANSDYVGLNSECNKHDVMARWKFVRVNGTDITFDALYKEFNSGYLVSENTHYILLAVSVMMTLFAAYIVIWLKRKWSNSKRRNKQKVKRGKVFHWFVRGSNYKLGKVKQK